MSTPNASSTACRYTLWPSEVSCTRFLSRADRSNMNAWAESRVPVPDKPGDCQLGIRVNAYPGPNIPVSGLPALLSGDVLFLGIAKAPDLIDLYPLGSDVADYAVVVVKARDRKST